jgi:hypothetical protein
VASVVNRPMYRPGRRFARWMHIALALGIVLLVLWTVGWFAANGNSVPAHSEWVWRKQSSVFLAGSGRDSTYCTIAPVRGAPRMVHIDTGSGFSWNVLAVHGVRLSRWFAGNASVSCDQPISTSSGPITWLYPISYTPIPILLGITLVVFGWGLGRTHPTLGWPSDFSMRVARFLMRR